MPSETSRHFNAYHASNKLIICSDGLCSTDITFEVADRLTVSLTREDGQCNPISESPYKIESLTSAQSSIHPSVLPIIGKGAERDRDQQIKKGRRS